MLFGVSDVFIFAVSYLVIKYSSLASQPPIIRSNACSDTEGPPKVTDRASILPLNDTPPKRGDPTDGNKEKTGKRQGQAAQEVPERSREPRQKKLPGMIEEMEHRREFQEEKQSTSHYASWLCPKTMKG